jgi:hypothetical protein
LALTTSYSLEELIRDPKRFAKLMEMNTHTGTTVGLTEEDTRVDPTIAAIERESRELRELREEADRLEMIVVRRGEIIASLMTVARTLMDLMRKNDLNPPRELQEELNGCRFELDNEETLLEAHADDRAPAMAALQKIREMMGRTQVTRSEILEAKRLADDVLRSVILAP